MTDSNPESRAFSQSGTRQPFQYVSDYQSNSYVPYQPPQEGTTFKDSQSSQKGFYTLSNQTTNYYPPQEKLVSRSESRVST